jgi:hypothetical protein
MNEPTLQKRVAPPACIANSLPKSGTHLLQKVIGLFPGMTFLSFHLGPNPAAPDLDEPATLDSMPVGVGRPRLMPRQQIRDLLSPLKRGTFITGHVPYSAEMASLLQELEIKMVSIIRDPRDVAVSRAKFVASTPRNPQYAYYQSLSEDERIMSAIVGFRQPQPGPLLRNLRDRIESVLQWKSQSLNLLTSFERLVGPQGGGSRELQLQEIGAIARHLGVHCTPQEIGSVADRAFGDTTTFRKGIIGSWREHFTEEHKRACKELVGQILIDLGYEKDLDW